MFSESVSDTLTTLFGNEEVHVFNNFSVSVEPGKMEKRIAKRVVSSLILTETENTRIVLISSKLVA